MIRLTELRQSLSILAIVISSSVALAQTAVFNYEGPRNPNRIGEPVLHIPITDIENGFRHYRISDESPIGRCEGMSWGPLATIQFPELNQDEYRVLINQAGGLRMLLQVMAKNVALVRYGDQLATSVFGAERQFLEAKSQFEGQLHSLFCGGKGVAKVFEVNASPYESVTSARLAPELGWRANHYVKYLTSARASYLLFSQLVEKVVRKQPLQREEMNAVFQSADSTLRDLDSAVSRLTELATMRANFKGAKAVNLAARQRMLSQVLVKSAVLLMNDWRSSIEMEVAAMHFSAALKILMEGMACTSEGLRIEKEYCDVSPVKSERAQRELRQQAEIWKTANSHVQELRNLTRQTLVAKGEPGQSERVRELIRQLIGLDKDLLQSAIQSVEAVKSETASR